MKFLKQSMLALVMLTTGIAGARAQNADDIMQKHINAMGGTANWDKIKSMKVTGTMSVQGNDMPVTQTIVNNKGMRTDFSMMGKTGYMIMTPTEGWVFQPGMEKPMALPAEQLKMSKDKLDIKSTQLLDKSRIKTLEYAGTDTVNSIKCYKLKVTDNDGNAVTAFFDAKTYYMLRTEAKVKYQEQEQEIAVNYSNFQKQKEGIVFPMTVGSPQGDIVFKTVEFNGKVSDNIFKPSDVKAGK